MKDFLRRNLVTSILGFIVIILLLLTAYFYFNSNKTVKNLKKENETLSQKYNQASEELKTKNAELDIKNKEIEDLKKAQNNTVQEEVKNDSNNSSEAATDNTEDSSIYNRVNGSDDFKSKVRNALDLMKSQDNEHFQIVAGQVSTINENDFYGGKQIKRDIYVSADNNPAITGSFLSHEAKHVYNVYVSKIWSYNTKEQELPCYEAELITAQRLGAPAFLISSIQSSIDHWNAQ